MDDMHSVSFIRCAAYDASLVAEAVHGVLAPLGGMEAVVRRGQRVLVKPNLLSDHRPEDAVTTHPEVLRAVLRELKAVGAEPFVGDSSASAVTVPAVWKATGVQAVCEDEGVPLVVMEGEGAREVVRDGFTFRLSAALARADAVINLPKVKTHALTAFTCGVKNLSGCVPGYQKAVLHRQVPRPTDFGRLLCALAREIRPVLTLADGIVGMEGEGPSAGSPVALGFLAASPSPFALDVEICATLGIPLRKVPYLRDVASVDPAATQPVRIGPSAEELRPESFAVPRTALTRLIPRRLARLARPLVWVRPTFDAPRCVRCGRCARACPAKAIDVDAGGVRLARARDCIGCCCCHEVCPQKIIRMRQSPLMRAAHVFRDI